MCSSLKVQLMILYSLATTTTMITSFTLLHQPINSNYHTSYNQLLQHDTRRQRVNKLEYARDIDAIVDTPSSSTRSSLTSSTKSITRSTTSSSQQKPQTRKSRKKQKNKQPNLSKPSKLDELWNTRYQELVDFYNHHGHSDVPYNHPNRKLSRWVTNQRHNKKLNKKCLTNERLHALNKVNFSFTKRCTWEDRFNELKQFSLMYGHCNVSSSTNVDLYRFVTSQLTQYKSYLQSRDSCESENGMDDNSSNVIGYALTESRVEALMSIGFDFRQNDSTKDSAWQAKYNQLKQFQKSQKHCNVPSKDINLSRWVNSQRTAFRLLQKGEKSSLSQKRIDLLNEIEFVWDPSATRFATRLNELKNMLNENQNNNISFTTNPSLHSWIHRQREQYGRLVAGKKSSLSKERIEAFSEVGVNLDSHELLGAPKQSHKISWSRKFHQLKRFAVENGHCVVPQKHAELGAFVRAQRNSYRLMKLGKKSSMTYERLNKLESIGFVWHVSNIRKPQSAKFATSRATKRENATKRALKRIALRKQLIASISRSDDPESLLKIYEKRSLWG